MNAEAEKKTYKDYPTYNSFIKFSKVPLMIAAKLHLVPKILYEKYAKF